MANIEHVPGQHWNKTVDDHLEKEREPVLAERARRQEEEAKKGKK